MLIPVYKVVATQFQMNSDIGDVEQGYLLAMDSSTGTLIKCTTGAANNADKPVGLAGDRKRAAVAYEWVNRVYDNGGSQVYYDFW